MAVGSTQNRIIIIIIKNVISKSTLWRYKTGETKRSQGYKNRNQDD
jgi:hypothetical protein